MFVVIIRRFAPAAGPDLDITMRHEIDFAEVEGCARVGTLLSLENRRDLFIISHWATREGAQRYVAALASANPSFIRSDDGLELRGAPHPDGASSFHLILTQEGVSMR